VVKKKEPTISNRYLDELLRVYASSFIREYVWTYLRRSDWGAEPNGLRLEPFRAWVDENLKDHRVQTMAAVRWRAHPDEATGNIGNKIDREHD
jgi:hypothetical protein